MKITDDTVLDSEMLMAMLSAAYEDKIDMPKTSPYCTKLDYNKVNVFKCRDGGARLVVF